MIRKRDKISITTSPAAPKNFYPPDHLVAPRLDSFTDVLVWLYIFILNSDVPPCCIILVVYTLKEYSY